MAVRRATPSRSATRRAGRRRRTPRHGRSDNIVSDYQKNGITANGPVNATITGNTVTGDGPINYIAQNGIQVGYGASAHVQRNTVYGNFYTPAI